MKKKEKKLLREADIIVSLYTAILQIRIKLLIRHTQII